MSRGCCPLRSDCAKARSTVRRSVDAVAYHSLLRAVSDVSSLCHDRGLPNSTEVAPAVSVAPSVAASKLQADCPLNITLVKTCHRHSVGRPMGDGTGRRRKVKDLDRRHFGSSNLFAGRAVDHCEVRGSVGVKNIEGWEPGASSHSNREGPVKRLAVPYKLARVIAAHDEWNLPRDDQEEHCDN